MLTLNIKTSVAAFGISLILAIVVILVRKEQHAKALLMSGVDVVKMKGKEFEEFLLVHFKNIGYSGYLTPDTNDYGADLIINKDSEVTAVQAKRWNKNVGVEAVQQVIARSRKIADYAKEMIEAQAALSKSDFNSAANSFLSFPIEKCLDSRDILLNVFALVDRRLGKKRILGMEDKIKLKHPIIQYFYELRRSTL